MSNRYPYAHNLYYCLRQLELALHQEGNLEFLRDYGQCSALTFTIKVSGIIDAIQGSDEDVKTVRH